MPVVPGSEGAVDIAEARAIIREMGLPAMLKAEGGGGGRGIFVIRNEEELEDAFLKASTMAQASFGNPRLFVEKYLEHVRHIEIQVIADAYGNVFAFDERDCSIQRNHQKLIEINAFSLGWPDRRIAGPPQGICLPAGQSRRLSVSGDRRISDYPRRHAVHDRGQYAPQVEHGITECRYGIDLVEQQIAVAFGVPSRTDP